MEPVVQKELCGWGGGLCRVGLFGGLVFNGVRVPTKGGGGLLLLQFPQL